MAARIVRYLGDLPESGKRAARDPFRILVGTVLSTRTKDEVTALAAERLLRRAPNPKALARMPLARLRRLIYPAGFYRVKARHLRELGETLLERHGGKVPSTENELLAIRGVGRKIANLVLGLGFGKPAICVDTHVHRISNRLGLVRTRRPAETEEALKRILPRALWIEWNHLLVEFGKRRCNPLSPRCGGCVLGGLCPRKGVVRSR